MGVGNTYVLINSQWVISAQISTTSTQATVARTSLVVREVSFRIVSNSVIGFLRGLKPRDQILVVRPMLRLLAIMSTHSIYVSLARIGVQLDVCPPVFLAAFGRCIRVQGFVRAVAGDPEARSREAVFFHQVLLYGVGALARKLHVVAALAGGISVAFNIDNCVFIRAHLAADFIHDRA